MRNISGKLYIRKLQGYFKNVHRAKANRKAHLFTQSTQLHIKSFKIKTYVSALFTIKVKGSSN